MLPDEMIEALVVAVLAVNNWSVEKVWAVLASGRRPDAVALLQSMKGIGPRVAPVKWQPLPA
jgi:hypothetical protein